MDVDTLRVQAQGVMFATLGVPVTVTRPLADSGPITTVGIWMARPLGDAQPVGSDLRRRDARKLMALPRDTTLTQVPRGTLIAAPELRGGTIKTWQVDGYEQPVEADEFRVVLIPMSEVI